MNTYNEIKYPRFISNAPLGDDLFEGQSQKITADCIKELLLNDDSCRVIGLDGQWGSGKSNLVKIVERLISDKYHTFVYDAWGHQEDLQRRSILEELTESLTTSTNNEEAVLESNKWKKKLKNLLAKSREVETKTIPKLSSGIVISGLVLILTPLCAKIAEITPYIWLAILVTCLPLLLLLGFFIKCCREQVTTYNIKGWTKVVKAALTHFFFIYKEKQTEDTTYETISEDEPSVKKFRDWMQEISNDLGEKNLLLVFDNMDRLPKQKVQELWSSIHTFFAETTYQNIRVIVPFDRAHIKAAFKDEDNPDRCFGDDFINKTFNVVFRVSLPILSDWKNYFKQKWNEALNDIDQAEYDRILQIFDAFCQNVTPREIVAFINEYVSIKLVCQKYTIPGRYITLFIFGKDRILTKHNVEILEPSYLGSLDFIYGNDENLPKYIASLTYQIDPENAIQIAYTKTLSTALNNNDSDTVLAISKLREFIDILSTILPNLNNYENVVLALDKVPADAFKTKYQSIWDDICARLLNDVIEGQVINPYQTILISKTSNKERYIKHILENFTNTKDFISTDYYESINKINELINDDDGFTVFDLLPTKLTTAEDFISLVDHAKKDYPKYQVSCSIKALDEYLSNLTVETLENISFIQYYNREDVKRLKKYAELLRTKFAEVADDTEKFSIILSRYKEIERPISTSISDAEIHNHFINLDEDNDVYYDIIAMRLARQNKFTATYASDFADILNSEEEDLANEIVSRIEYYIQFDNYLLGLENFNKYPLYVSVAKKLISESYGISTAYIPQLIFRFDEIVNWSGANPQKLLQRLNAWSQYIHQITTDNISKVPISFFITARSNRNSFEIADYCIKTAITYLDSLSEEQWAEALQTSTSYILKLSSTLDYPFSQAAFDATKSTLKSIATGELSIPNQKEWDDRIERIDASKKSLVGTFNSVRDAIIRQDNMTSELFIFFGKWLFKYAHLSRKEESLRTILPSHILDDDNVLEILIQNKEKLPAIIAAAKDEKKDFIDKILSLKSKHRNKKYQNFLEFLSIDKQKRSRKKKKI